MNERILKLAVEAGLYIDLNGTPWPRAMSAEECEAAYKKFAELIVEECVRKVRNRGGMCGALASNWIEEHFYGVEE